MLVNLLQRGEKNGKPVWRLRWETKDPGTGERRYEYRTVNGPRREAERAWIAHEAEIRQAGAGYVKPAKDTLGDYLDTWLRDYVDVNCKPSTAASYRVLVRTHILPRIGAVPLRELTAPLVAAWQADVARTPSGRSGGVGADGKRAPAPLSPRRVAYARAVLRAALHEAVRQRLIPSNPVELVRAPRQAPKQVEAFTLQEARALDVAAQGNRLAALFAVAWRTGLRLGELLALRWEDVDFEAGTVTVGRNVVEVGGKRIVQDTPKTEKGRRTMALAGTTAALLKAHKARQAAERLAAGDRWRGGDLVFCTGTGGLLAGRNVERLFYLLRDRAGLPAHGFHSLRHTYATLAKRAGVDIGEIADALGHESPAFTAKTYAHVLPEGRREAARRFETFTEGEGR